MSSPVGYVTVRVERNEFLGGNPAPDDDRGWEVSVPIAFFAETLDAIERAAVLMRQTIVCSAMQHTPRGRAMDTRARHVPGETG